MTRTPGPKQRSSPSARTSRTVDEKEFASIGGSVSPMTLCNEAYASIEAKSRGPNIRIIMTFCNAEHSAIKLNRTDTTLDLSQRQRELKKKEKRRKFWGQGHLLIGILRAVGLCHYSQIRQTTT